MKLKNKSVLVTGAGGFVGSHLTEKLASSGCSVRAFVRYNSRNDWGMIEAIPQKTADRIEIVAGDLRDSEAVRLATKDVDVVFHLGALIAIPYSYYHPRETIETNIMGTLNVLNAAKDAGVEKVVHTSTSEVYGTAQYVPIDEKHPLQGQSPYSASKIGADKIAESYFRSFGLPVGVIRPFNTYGPRQSARAVIPNIIIQAQKEKKVSLGSLHPTRDYTYVKDLADAFVKFAESDKTPGKVVNVGSNFEISIGELAEKIIKLMGKKTEIVQEKQRIRPQDSEVERLWCDNSQAKKLLGWRPETTLDAGLAETIRWVSENLDKYKSGVYNI